LMPRMRSARDCLAFGAGLTGTLPIAVVSSATLTPSVFSTAPFLNVESNDHT
jgi:hypothetical protein